MDAQDVRESLLMAVGTYVNLTFKGLLRQLEELGTEPEEARDYLHRCVDGAYRDRCIDQAQFEMGWDMLHEGDPENL